MRSILTRTFTVFAAAQAPLLSLLPAFALTAGFAAPAPAQDVPVISLTEEIEFDRPEAWAMKYFASVGTLTGLGAPRVRDVGSVEMGFEAGWIPGLSAEERTVGFSGTKEEDLDRLSVFGRLRATVGLPNRFGLTAGWVPPVEVSGVKTNLVSLALERPFVQRGPWGLGFRLHGQTGKVEGDFTCSGDDLRLDPGAPGNEFGCEARSNDTYELTQAGLELTGSYAVAGENAPRLHLGVAANRLDAQFQVDALTFGFRDRTRLVTDGWTWSVNAGAEWLLSRRTGLAAELFYTPLDVVRPPAADSRNDDLLNARVILRYRLR